MNATSERTLLALEASGAWSLALAVAAFVVLLVLQWRAVSQAPRRRRGVLLALRAALALALVLLALRVVVRTESLSVGQTPVAVVVDTSASMGVRDQQDGRTRLEAIAAWAREHSSELDALSADALVEWFTTSGDEVRAVSRERVASGELEASGGTDLVATVQALAERYPGRQRPGILLLSDGADHGALRDVIARAGGTDGTEGTGGAGGAGGDDLVGAVAELVGGEGLIVPVAPSAGGLTDLAVDLLAHDPIGFLRTDVTIRARVRAAGIGRQDVPVSLEKGDELITVRSVTVGGEAGEAADVTFTVRPNEVGETLYSVSVPVQSGEAVQTNNEALFAVRVVRDRIRALQVVGRPSWDGRFLRELLKRDPAIDLVSFFILRQAWDDTNTSDVAELSLIPFPVAELFGEKLRGFDVVIFQNFDFEPYGIGAHLDAVREHVVVDGGALAVIGGDLAFGRDYRRDPMREVLPVELAPRVAWEGGRHEVASTDVGRRHPILTLGVDGEGEEEIGSNVATRVERLLPVEGVNTGLAPKPGAHVLLETADAERRPLVVVGEAGAGRTMAVASDGTWRWSLPMAGRGLSPRGYEAFWENSMRWLLEDPRAALVVLEADRRAVAPGETLEVRVHVRQPSYAAATREPVVLRVEEIATGETLEYRLATDEAGVARHVFDPKRSGLHAFTATTALGEAGPLHVERIDPGRELADPAIDLTVLEALVEATGADRVRRLDDDSLELPFAAERDVRVEAVRTHPLWRTWWAWGLVVGLACSEWWLRRRWGLA